MIIVVPDVHGRKFWREVIGEKAERIIFLGDYLDPYTWGENISREESEEEFLDILKFKKENPDLVTLLLGNHDYHYFDLSWSGRGSRFSAIEMRKYHRWFVENKNLFNLFTTEGNYLFSHAGITKSWLEYNKLELPKDIDSWWPDKDMLGQVGLSRGGFYLSGSPLWADYDRDVSGDELDGWIQVVGHTQHGRVVRTDKSICIDCHDIFRLE